MCWQQSGARYHSTGVPQGSRMWCMGKRLPTVHNCDICCPRVVRTSHSNAAVALKSKIVSVSKLWSGCSLKEVVGVGWPTCTFVLCLPSPAVRATAVTSLLGGLGHHLLSVPLSAPSLTETVSSNLYCGAIAKQQKTHKKPNVMTV